MTPNTKTADVDLRELNLWIELHIFGVIRKKCPTHLGLECCGRGQIPRYTTDPSDAMEVLRKCLEKSALDKDRPDVRMDRIVNGYSVGLRYYGHEYRGELTQEAPTLELAICLFARALFSK